MKKERKQFILNIFKSYNDNKEVLKILSLNPLNSMSVDQRKYFNLLKTKVEIVDVVLHAFSYQSSNKRDFVVRRFINGETQNQLAFSCFVAESTIRRWEEEVFNKTDSLLNDKRL